MNENRAKTGGGITFEAAYEAVNTSANSRPWPTDFEAAYETVNSEVAAGLWVEKF